MSPLKTLAHDLVERRLWPVAVVLVLALIAVPVFLLKSGSDSPPAQSPEALRSAEADGAPETVVSAAPGATLKNEQRRLVGTAKDPFAATAPESPAAAAAGTGSGSAATAAPAGGAGATVSAPAQTSSPGTSSVTTPAARVPAQVTTAPAARRTVHRYYVVDVRFGRVGRASGRANVARLQPLPTSGRPALVFLGAFNGGTSAGFLVARGAVVAANSCAGRPTNCSILRLRPGRVARIAVAGPRRTVRSYELSVVRIRRVTTGDARRASRARSRVSRAGRCLLSTDNNAFGSVMFDPRDGAYRSVTPGKGSCGAVSASASSASFPAVELDVR